MSIARALIDRLLLFRFDSADVAFADRDRDLDGRGGGSMLRGETSIDGRTVSDERIVLLAGGIVARCHARFFAFSRHSTSMSGQWNEQEGK